MREDTVQQEINNHKQQFNMKDLFDNIQSKMIELSKDMERNVHNGNKSAGVRARKATLELEKMFKEYRKESVKAVKK